jgi:large subunit ribosomal protein L3
MKGIVGKKLGMTQVFDEETGSLTPVTVIQAGPCPVVAIRTADTDGYDAVQLAFDEVSEEKLSKPKLGHLKKHNVGPHRKLVEIRGAHELAPGETVTVESFEPGEKVKVSGISIGKGFQGSIGASATPSRVFKGQKMPGQMGAKTATQVGLTVVDRDPELNLLLVKGAVPGHKNAIVVVREDVR